VALFGKSRGEIPASYQRPPGTSGLTLSVDDIEDLYFSMNERWRDRETESSRWLWVTRMEVGYSVPHLGELRQTSQFWFDAYPVLGALVLKLIYEPVVDQTFLRFLIDQSLAKLDPTNKSQMRAMADLKDAVS
jgi:hypothetical protein